MYCSFTSTSAMTALLMFEFVVCSALSATALSKMSPLVFVNSTSFISATTFQNGFGLNFAISNSPLPGAQA